MDYREWCDWSNVEEYVGYYDPFQTGVEEEIVTFGGALGIVADAAVVAAVMCSESHVDLRVSEGPGLFDNMETGPWPKSSGPGEVSHLPILSDIRDSDFKGPSLVFGDVPYPPVPGGGIIYEPGPAEPELGDTLGWPDFSADIDLGPGESFPRSGSTLVGPVILDDCVPDPGRYLPESGVIPDGPGSANNCGMEGCK